VSLIDDMKRIKWWMCSNSIHYFIRLFLDHALHV